MHSDNILSIGVTAQVTLTAFKSESMMADPIIPAIPSVNEKSETKEEGQSDYSADIDCDDVVDICITDGSDQETAAM